MKHATVETIIHAAIKLVLTEGVNGLTIEAVARTANLSKGGVLYHFRSKENLIEGMVGLLVQGFEADLEQELAKESPRGSSNPGAFTRAFLRASLNPINSQKDKQASSKLGLFAALSAGTALDPALLKPLRDGFTRWQKRIEQDGIDPAMASIVRMAVDGLWFSEVLQLGVPNARMRKEMLDVLDSMTKPKKL